MGRIEDSEAERAERLAQERKIQEKAVEAKKVAENRQFSQVVAQMQQTRGQQSRQDAQKEQQKQAASRTLMAKKGIASNDAQGAMLSRNNRLNDEGRRLMQQKEGERARGRQEVAQGDHKPTSSVSGETRAVGGGAKQGKEGRSQGQEERRAKSSANETAPTGMDFAAQVHATANAITGVGGRAGPLGSGVPATLTTKEIIDHIVSQVRAGRDSKGLGLIQIDLREDILAGSRLTFLSSQSGVVHLKLDTGDPDVERLMTSGQTLTDLSKAMQRADINRPDINLTLEVNGTRVLG